MAEIHVQPKKKSSSAWVWILISLLIIAAIVVYVMMRNNPSNPGASLNQKSQTSAIQYHLDQRVV